MGNCKWKETFDCNCEGREEQFSGEECDIEFENYWCPGCNETPESDGGILNATVDGKWACDKCTAAYSSVLIIKREQIEVVTRDILTNRLNVYIKYDPYEMNISIGQFDSSKFEKNENLGEDGWNDNWEKYLEIRYMLHMNDIGELVDLYTKALKCTLNSLDEVYNSSQIQETIIRDGEHWYWNELPSPAEMLHKKNIEKAKAAVNKAVELKVGLQVRKDYEHLWIAICGKDESMNYNSEIIEVGNVEDMDKLYAEIVVDIIGTNYFNASSIDINFKYDEKITDLDTILNEAKDCMDKIKDSKNVVMLHSDNEKFILRVLENTSENNTVCHYVINAGSAENLQEIYTVLVDYAKSKGMVEIKQGDE